VQAALVLAIHACLCVSVRLQGLQVVLRELRELQIGGDRCDRPRRCIGQGLPELDSLPALLVQDPCLQ